ncbi:MAG TPA: pyrroloquinoline-quinone synthase PqqC [Nitrospiraceae bacterium]|nr:pyrroloquinoline-quinone synthase PqqC [Nitrospiraceae bacterium]
MMEEQHRDPLSKEAFVEWLRREGSIRYHDHHPFHELMHDGKLTKTQLQQWVLNRYYYQTRIPVKDAFIVAKSEDPNFRRIWLRRIQDHDGQQDGEGGLALWLGLARGVGLDVDEVKDFRSVLPGVRLVCDEYVQFVRESPLLDAVASSLTELFAPTLMVRRIEAWKHHYPWVGSESLAYFQLRISRATVDSEHAVEFVTGHATTYAQQERCVQALIRKAEMLWAMLDCIYMAYVEPESERRKTVHEYRHI